MNVTVIKPTLKEHKVLRACAYVRVSTNKKAQEDSLENQAQYYERLIRGSIEYEYAGVFIDDGISGTKEKRDRFQRMVAQAKNGHIDVILTKSISRFARNTVILLKTVRALKDVGVEIIFEKENIHTLSGDGELMLAVLSSFAQEESNNISENRKWRVRYGFKTGEMVLNTKRFLGYTKNEVGELVPVPSEAKIIQRIFSEYIEGKGSYLIAKGLNRDSVPTVTGAKWHDATILQILKNEKYKGDYLFQKYYSPNHIDSQSRPNNGILDSYYAKENHIPIISRDDWDIVQVLIKIRGAIKGNTEGDRRKYQNRYPQSGLLYCGECGAKLKRCKWNQKTNFSKVVWQCSRYIKDKNACCRGTTIEEEHVLNIKEPTTIGEVMRDGKKHYIYTSKSK